MLLHGTQTAEGGHQHIRILNLLIPNRQLHEAMLQSHSVSIRHCLPDERAHHKSETLLYVTVYYESINSV